MKLIHKASNRLVRFWVEEGIIAREDSELYRYGTEAGMMMAVNVIISAAIGIWAGMLMECMLFLLFYIPVRSYAGGYHAPAIGTCTLWSQAIVCVHLAVLFLADKVFGTAVIYWLLSLVIHMPGIIRRAPKEAKNKPLNENEKKRYKNYVVMMLAAELFISAAALAMGESRVAATAANVMLVQHILLLI